MRRQINRNPLRKVIGEQVFNEWPREDWIETDDGFIVGVPHELLECGHAGPSVLDRGEWFGVGFAKRRRCAECGRLGLK